MAHASRGRAGTGLAVASLVAGVARTASAQPTSLLATWCCDPAPALAAPAVDTLPGLVRAGANAAGLTDAFAPAGADRARVAVGAGRTDGAFRRPQQPATASALTFAADGARSFRGASSAMPRWVATGRFAYARRANDDVRWSNVADPYAGVPYVWADSVGGDWRRDDVAVGAAAGGPLGGGRLAAGLSADYAIGQGARANDPRPLWRRRWLALAPGVSVRLGRATRLGVSGTVGWEREDQEIGGGTSTEFPVLFRLRGAALFDRTQLVSAQRVVHGRALGAGVQLAGASRDAEATANDAVPRWRWAVGAHARTQRDSVRDGVATPVTGGFATRRALGAAASVRRSGRRGAAELTVDGAHETARGTDPVFRAVNAVDEAWRGGATLALWRGADRALARRALTASAAMRRLARRDVAAEVEWWSLRPDLALGASTRHDVAIGTLLVGLEGRLATAHDARWRAARDGRLVDVLARPDFVVGAAGRTGLAGVVALERRGAGGLHRLHLDAAWTTPRGTVDGTAPSGRRTLLSLTYELRT